MGVHLKKLLFDCLAALKMTTSMIVFCGGAMLILSLAYVISKQIREPAEELFELPIDDD